MDRLRVLFFIALFKLFLPASFFAGTRTDSLFKIIRTGQKDTAVASALNGVASLFVHTDIKNAWTYSDSALALSKELGFAKGIAEAMNTKGIICLNHNEYKRALLFLSAGYRIYEALKNKRGLARIVSNIGIAYDLQGQYDLAMDHYQKALALNLELNDQRGIGYSYNNIGVIYHNEGNLPEALSNYLKGLKARQNAGDITGITGSYSNVGLVYISLKDFDKALFYLDKAVELVEKYNDKLTAATLYSQIGQCYNEKNKFAEAEQFYRKALKLSYGNEDTYAVILNLNSLGENFQDLNKNDSAFAYYTEAYTLSKAINSKTDQGIMLHNLASLAMADKKYKEALDGNLQAEKVALEINDLILLSGIQEGLSICYEKLNRPAEALDYYKRYIASRDSVFNEDNTKKNVRTEMNFEFEKKEAVSKAEQEKKEAVAAAENKKQVIIIRSVCGILVLVLAFAFFVYRSFIQKKKANVEISRQKYIIEEKQKEILDSIYYARRIQRSLLPTEKYIERVTRILRS